MAAIVLGWSPLVPVAVALVGGTYAVELAIDDAPLDVSVPVIALSLLFAAELAYWSLDERDGAKGEPGDDLRRSAYVAGLGLAALLVAAVVLALVDAVRARGLGVDVAGAAAASLALLAVVLFARGRGPAG